MPELSNGHSEEPVIVIPRRFHGPPNSGNGGYVCGRLARFIDGAASVRLRMPPPLDSPLQVRRTSGAVLLVDGESIVAEGRSTDFELSVPPAPSLAEAEAAARAFAGFQSHRFPACFVCGPERAAGDGLRIFAGPIPRRGIVACAWTPDAAVTDLSADIATDGGGVAAPEFIWAVLDCPGGFAFPEPAEGTVVLGELAVRVLAPVHVGAPHIVIGWEISREGRKHHTGTALFTEAGACCAYGRGVWIEVAGF